jgi:O-antigen/teichoic acid export membrane protein
LWVVLFATGIITAVLVARYFSSAPPGPLVDRNLTAPAWNYGLKSYLSSLFTIAAMRVGILFVNQYHGTAEAGLYSTAQQVMELLIIVPSVLGSVLFGRISDGKSDHLTSRLIRVVMIGYLPVMIGLFLFTDSLISFLFGEQFVAASTATRIMLPGSFLLGLEVILVNDLRGHGYPWKAVLIWIPAFALALVAYTVTTPRWGINGAAMVTTVMYTVVFVYIANLYRRYAGQRYMTTYLPTRADLSGLHLALMTVLGSVSHACHIGKSNDRARIAHEEPSKTETLGAPR